MNFLIADVFIILKVEMHDHIFSFYPLVLNIGIPYHKVAVDVRIIGVWPVLTCDISKEIVFIKITQIHLMIGMSD